MQHTGSRLFSATTLRSALFGSLPMLWPRRWLPVLRKRWIASIAILSLALVVTLVVGQSAPNIPPINLSSDPLFAATGGDKPVIALALSVEYPTVGAQYVASPGAVTDETYSNTKEYLGYYDAESCYSYNKTPTETPATGLTATDYQRFDRSGAAGTGTSLHMCADAFSGNFLNWASSSAIDMLRLALSGGDRYIDTADLTILQRAVLPNNDPVCMWNSGNFPAKRLQRNGGGTGKYWGAVPTAMITEAGSNDIWVANTLNRIYFGNSSNYTGSCDNPTAYKLGNPQSSLGPISQTYTNTSLPTTNTPVLCAPEGSTSICTFSGIREVWFGAGNRWIVRPASNSVICSTAVLTEPASGVVKACYIRAYTGTWTPPTPTTNSLNSDGFFYSRVKVCNVSSSALQDVRDYGLCRQYPSGNFKPIGSIQKYSDQLRLAAFGYLMDQTASYSTGGRYGGVLRAPMKFVGAKTFDIAGQDNTPTTGNPNVEWNVNTGVFNANPDSNSMAISGVINYLNKFGRTGPVAGRYKKYDPVGELHYEVLRYLQGLGPTAAAISSITTDMYDGYPVYTTWTDPYGGGRSNTADYSCLKSNIVTIGDVNTHDGNRLPTTSIANNIPDISAWRSTVQAFEKNQTAVTYTDGQGVPGRAVGNPNGANTSVPSGTTTSQIMGTAYWSHTHDIRGKDWTANPALQRPGLRTKSFFFDVNENGSSNSDSYRRYQNQFFMAGKYGGFESDAANIGGKPYNTFGNPFKRQDGTNDNNVWQDAANPGEASTYYLQSSARGVLNAFDSIFSRASTSARSIAGSATSSPYLTSAGIMAYQGSFDTSDWSGDVLSIPQTLTGTSTVTVGTTPNWTAATRLANLTAPAATRNIVVGKPGATADPTANDFTWTGITGSTLQTSLDKVNSSATADGLAQDRLNYLRGDQSKEGTIFRTRSKLLGDIVNSGVVYAGAPTTTVGPSTTYSGFYTANASRTPAVYVGANDGMMHAFNANTGDELFAYIPSWMESKLAALTSKTYTGNHQPYVDSTPAVGEAQVGSAGTSADWRTVLVSGTGGGGSGVFALDVTDPSAFSTSKVMWEFTRADDPDLGFVVGRPEIVKLRTSALGASPATYRWFAVVASGVNNYAPDSAFPGIYSTTGNPALFLLALDKPVGTAWTSTGSTPNYYKISVPVDSTLSATTATGLINFRATFGLAAEVAQIYMGDLHGKLWKLDFSIHGSDEWAMDRVSAYKKSSVAYPFYIAKTATAIQPISMAPTVVAGPSLSGVSTAYVAFTTGKYLETSDRTSTTQDSIYVIYDNGTTTADSTNTARLSVITGRGRLIAGSVNASTGVVSVAPFNYGRPMTDTDTSQRAGWYLDFSTLGERGINNAKVSGDDLIFNSLIPASSGAVGSCAAAGGGGKPYTLNIDTGNGRVTTSTVGLLGEPLLVELLSATTYTVSTTTGRRIKTVVKQMIQQGSQGMAAGSTTTSTVIAGRLSWRQINNYQDLHAP